MNHSQSTLPHNRLKIWAIFLKMILQETIYNILKGLFNLWWGSFLSILIRNDLQMFQENYIGPSDCEYIISDADGWINYITMTVTGTVCTIVAIINFEKLTLFLTEKRKWTVRICLDTWTFKWHIQRLRLHTHKTNAGLWDHHSTRDHLDSNCEYLHCMGQQEGVTSSKLMHIEVKYFFEVI